MILTATNKMLLHLIFISSCLLTTSPIIKAADNYGLNEIYSTNLADSFFKILYQENEVLLIGARNNLFHINLIESREVPARSINWNSTPAHTEMCTLKGKNEIDCQNYIRVFAQINDKEFMICGTSSFKPMCRYYEEVLDSLDDSALTLLPSSTDSSARFKLKNEVESQGRCPCGPQYGSAIIYADDHLYSGTLADFSGSDPLIYREPQRTEQYNLNQLNQPTFVSAFDNTAYVYLFFREIAVENIVEDTVYSRIGRICKNDKGSQQGSERWTTYLKARLNCSIKGEINTFHYNELQATSQLINGKYRDNVTELIIYGIFTTPANPINGSAVCAFTMKDIENSFDGQFIERKNADSRWLTVPKKDVPAFPRPGACVNDSRLLQAKHTTFVRTHPLMESPVASLYQRPILAHLPYKLTAITVDPQNLAKDGLYYDVIYVATERGEIKKFVNNGEDILSENNGRIILNSTLLITELTISDKTNRIIIITDSNVQTIPTFDCEMHKSCTECVNLYDPHCAWDVGSKQCVSTKGLNIADNKKMYLQNIRNDNDIKQCSVGSSSKSMPGNIYVSSFNIHNNKKPLNGIISSEYNPINEPFENGSIIDSDNNTEIETTKTWIWYLFLLSIGILIIGIGLGICLSKRLYKNSSFSEHRNQLSWNGKSRHSKDVNLLMNSNNPFTPPTPLVLPPCNNKKDNLQYELDGGKDRSHECKNSTESLEKETRSKTGTLQKVKKTYI